MEGSMPSLAEGAGVDNEVLEAFLASVCERADDEGVNLLTTASQELFERRVPMVEWPFELEGLLLVPTCLALGPHWVLMVADFKNKMVKVFDSQVVPSEKMKALKKAKFEQLV
jgi:hypothetical protein